MLGKYHMHLELPKVKVATIKIFHDFQRLHLKYDIFLTQMLNTNTLCLSTQMKLQVGKLKFEIFLSSNLSHSIGVYHKTQPLTRKPTNI
jgi:hypothetical protein